MNQQEHDEMKMMMGEDKEIWAKIEGYEGYEISTYGRVRSFWKRTGRGKGSKGGVSYTLGEDYQVLSPILCGGSYAYYACIFKGKNKKVHRLVAETFIPNLDGFLIIDHIDGNRLNNHISNLRWSNHTLNNLNTRLYKNNQSGQKGVYATLGGWKAQWQEGKKMCSKWFKDKNDAIEHRKKMVEQHYDLDFYKDG